MPRSKTFFPYEHSSDLQLRPSDFFDPSQEELPLELSERPSPAGEILEFDLTGEEKPWKRLEIEVRADIPENTLRSLLPENTDPEKETAVLVSTRCAATKYRGVVRLRSTDTAEWRGSTSVRREDVRSTVELHPLLVRTSSVPDADPEQLGVAVDTAAILAEGRGIRLNIDETNTLGQNGPKISWQDFRASDDTWKKDHSSDLFFLEPEGDEPTLWLNSSYSQLKEILHGTDERGVDAALRYMANGLLAQTVWIQLFLTAATAVEVDEEVGEVESPGGWKGDVLKKFLPRLFPNESSEDVRLRELVDMMRSPDRIGVLAARLGSVVQDVPDTPGLFQDAVRAAEEDS